MPDVVYTPLMTLGLLALSIYALEKTYREDSLIMGLLSTALGMIVITTSHTTFDVAVFYDFATSSQEIIYTQLQMEQLGWLGVGISLLGAAGTIQALLNVSIIDFFKSLKSRR
ncbi:hypothetical protein [Methanococcus maripaludis]|uniref:Uncharacterized protein n=1 Tax=Methanococcus maripaludis TaxID=39152 RepID=A0A7J9PMJ6_METMI|nr:hypothetical protein [Methanococcus maripaludis]MBA2864435.1 hypothetical protein [Methanococcus maripaludis]